MEMRNEKPRERLDTPLGAVERPFAKMLGGLGGLALFAGKYAVLNTATRPPNGGLGKRSEISCRSSEPEMRSRENESMRQNNVANLADQSQGIDIKELRTSILVRHLADQTWRTWRSSSLAHRTGVHEDVEGVDGVECLGTDRETASGFQGGNPAPCEKRIGAGRKNAAPLELLGNSSGFLRVLPGAQAALLEPLGICTGFLIGLERVE
jgi:hypothetical protein